MGCRKARPGGWRGRLLPCGGLTCCEEKGNSSFKITFFPSTWNLVFLMFYVLMKRGGISQQMSKETCQLLGSGISSNRAVIFSPCVIFLYSSDCLFSYLIWLHLRGGLFFFMLPTSWSIFKIVPLGVHIETGICWIHRFSIMLSENAISLQMKLPNILECRIDLSKPTAFGVTNSCVLKGPQYWTSSCQKLLAGFQEKLLNFQEGKLQLRKKQSN